MKSESSLFPARIQQLLAVFAFFLAFPSIAIGSSITFYIFIFLAYQVNKDYGYVFKIRDLSDFLFLAFPLVGLVSLIVAPSLRRTPGVMADFQIWVQYAYWCVLALFIKSHGVRFNWALIFKSFFWGINFLTISFFFVGVNFGLGPVSFFFRFPRNAFVFQLLCLVPFCLYYVRQRWGGIWFGAFAFAYFLIALLTEGRAGSILLLTEVILLVIILSGIFTSFVRICLLAILLLGVTLVSDEKVLEDERQSLASIVEPYNNRLATLITGEGEGDLSSDQSWVLRKLMVDKALEIYSGNPWFGIGLNHFTRFDARLATLKKEPSYQSIRGESQLFYNTRSAHNSYFQVLAETGIVGFFVFALILVVPLIKIVIGFIFNPSVYHAFGISLLIICIHFYVISSITGAIGWFVIGVSYFFSSSESRLLLSHSGKY